MRWYAGTVFLVAIIHNQKIIFMKRSMVTSFFLAGAIFISSCNDASNTNDTDNAMDTATGITRDDTINNNNSILSPDNTMADDSGFVLKAAEGGLMEVQLGKLALKNASSAAVKKHAQMMVNDHGKANTELKTLAKSKNITLPTALGSEKQNKYDELKGKTGAEFDKDYTSYMVDDHKKDIEDFKKQAERGFDAEIKSWAAGKVPTLESHLQMWESAKNEL